MAQVTSDVSVRIDHFLAYLIPEWESVPAYAEELATWDEVEQLAFVHEWDIRESGLRVLREYAEEGLMTPDQSARYDQLLSLVADHRPTLERLLANDEQSDRPNG